MVFVPGRNFVGSLSSTSCGRSSRNLRPFMLASFLVETTDPSTFARNIYHLLAGPHPRSPALRRSTPPSPRAPIHYSLAGPHPRSPALRRSKTHSPRAAIHYSLAGPHPRSPALRRSKTHSPRAAIHYSLAGPHPRSPALRRSKTHSPRAAIHYSLAGPHPRSPALRRSKTHFPRADHLFLLRQHGVHVVVRPRDDVDADELALHSLDRLGAGVGGGLDRSDVAYHDGRDQRI